LVTDQVQDVTNRLSQIVFGGCFWERNGMWEKQKGVDIACTGSTGY
jgi:peptide methionine sulfoxide reductase MsrA